MVAIQRDNIVKKIDRIEYYEKVLHFAFNHLADEEKEVIELFFFSHGYIAPFVRKYGEKYGYSSRGVYRKRREVLSKMTKTITENFL